MPDKYPKEVKEECVRLRKEEGVKHKDIATILNVSLPTIKRWLKGIKVLKETSGTQVTDKPTVTQGAEGTKVSQVINTLSDTKNTENIRETGETEVTGDVFKGTKVSYDLKTSEIIIGATDNEVDLNFTTKRPEIRELETPNTSESLASVPGAFKHTAIKDEKLNIDAPDNVLDNFFNRGLIEVLVPIGLLTAGFLMSKKDTTSNQFAGEQIRSNPGWLNENRRSEDW